MPHTPRRNSSTTTTKIVPVTIPTPSKPVSYTHLDVYKRQHTARDLAQEGRRGAARLVTILGDSAGYLSTLTFVRILLETCLLYTSRCV